MRDALHLLLMRLACPMLRWLQVVVPLGAGDITQPFLLRDVYASQPLPFTRKVRS